MTTNIKAIDTEYKGYLFRSRLEARWAVFMDAMGVRYEYESEGYDLDGIWYLPDFWLPNLKAHLEIKPVEPTPEEEEKAGRLAEHTEQSVYVLIGQPECPDVDGKWCENESQAYRFYHLAAVDNHYLWCECPHCHRCELQYDGRADRIGCKCPKSEHGDKGYNFDSYRLQAAYARARGYRFEPRESVLIR